MNEWGIRQRACRARRLLAAARREQRSRQRPQPRLRWPTLHRRPALRAHPPDPPRRPRRPRRLSHRHPTTRSAQAFRALRSHAGAPRQVPTMIERDDHIPPLAELLAELDPGACHRRRIPDIALWAGCHAGGSMNPGATSGAASAVDTLAAPAGLCPGHHRHRRTCRERRICSTPRRKATAAPFHLPPCLPRPPQRSATRELSGTAPGTRR